MLSAPGPRAALGITTAALATVTLFGESASAAPAKPSIQEVQAQVDKLYQQAEVATERYNGAKEQADQQRKKADQLLDQVARRTQKLNDARSVLGEYAAAQYRDGGLGQTTTFLLSKDPQQFLDNSHLMDRMSSRQARALETYRTEQAQTTQKRLEAVQSLAKLTAAQNKLQTQKQTVQAKLAETQKLLNSLTAQEKARLAALQKQQEEAAAKKAAALIAKAQANSSSNSSSGSSSGSSSSGSSSSSSTVSGSYTTKADKAIAFARAQLGKPYVYGATGPNSYDCSGLTQAAWAAAGVSIPRTTYAQVDFGTRVSASQLHPGDLVFFYSGVSHVGLYIGGGEMIHAPHTGSTVKIAPITEMPIYGYARMA
jgi:cell wall-associated NlpC family hydrolase